MVGIAGWHYWHWISLAVRTNDLMTRHLIDIDVVPWVRATQVAIHTFGAFPSSTIGGKKNSAALIPVKSSLHVVPKWRACSWLIQLRLLSWQQTTNDEIPTDDSKSSASNRLLYKCTHTCTSHVSCSKRCLPWTVSMYELGKTGRAFIWRRQRVSDW